MHFLMGVVDPSRMNTALLHSHYFQNLLLHSSPAIVAGSAVCWSYYLAPRTLPSSSMVDWSLYTGTTNHHGSGHLGIMRSCPLHFLGQ